ncbi:hypothetical protein [Telmatospirillum sp.]|uniref:hypothetical protein n=1 Tax=Telmatospirillum sp. TaxID=2079197 RepID=UPI00284540DB|nr:hypothetical protein [Telmatospirillum sp.]MDR3435502.1 hypothetical protein [Telmatospirillum sp.]
MQRTRALFQGKAKIDLKASEVLNRYKMTRHFDLTIGENSFGFCRKTEAIAGEAPALRACS